MKSKKQKKTQNHILTKKGPPKKPHNQETLIVGDLIKDQTMRKPKQKKILKK